MADAKKYEFNLENLSCADCSLKIERELRKLDGVGKASVSFFDKSLEIDVMEGRDIPAVLESSHRLIQSIEPEILITEKRIEKPRRKIYLMLGLCCESCAKKIEQEIQEIEGVTDARIDFGRGELALDVIDDEKTARILSESRRRAKRIVRGLRLTSDEEKRRFRLRFKLVSLVAGVPFYVIGLLEVFPGIGLFFYIAAFLLFGFDVLWRAVKNIGQRKFFDENFLMTVATIGAFCVGAYPEGAAVMLFYKIGTYLEDRAVERSRRQLKTLFALKPDTARLVTANRTREVRPEDVAIGDTIIVAPGERVPLDGRVSEGSSSVDNRLVTGEAVPVRRSTGDSVFAGSINQNSPLTIRVEKQLSDSLVTRIRDFVEKAAAKKSKAEHFIGKFTRYYTPLVVGAALLLAFLPPLLFPGQALSDWVYRALIFLVISCPCALVLSIPLSFSSGIGSLAKHGILVKGAQYVEVLREVRAAAFDKTGTLTAGVFEVATVHSLGKLTSDEIIALAATAEAWSDHPLAQAIRRAYGKSVDTTRLEASDEKAGRGVSVRVDGRKLIVGNAGFLEENAIQLNSGTSGTTTEQSGTSVHLAVDGRHEGFIVVADRIKPNAAKALASLRTSGVVRLAMLSGDSFTVARAVGDALDLDEVHAPLLPEQKVERFERLKNSLEGRGKIMAVGDGVNDTPLLSRADVGVAMGGMGRDAAIEVADVVVMDDDLEKLPLAIRIARKTHRIVIQNIFLAFGVKAAVLALGAFGVATMWEAVFADVGVALLALLNSLRLFGRRVGVKKEHKPASAR